MCRIAMLVAAAASIGCRSATSPYAEVTSAVELTPRVVGPGDTVQVPATATNRGRRAVSAGVGCGAGLDFDMVRSGFAAALSDAAAAERWALGGMAY